MREVIQLLSEALIELDSIYVTDDFGDEYDTVQANLIRALGLVEAHERGRK